jgi:hypothetical protein
MLCIFSIVKVSVGLLPQIIFSNLTRKGIMINAKHSFKMYAFVLGAALSMLSSSSMAGMVSTDQVAEQSQLDADKVKIQNFVERADVRDQLQALGVGETMAKVRVAAMTDQEVHEMALKIDSMPAGGYVRNSDLILVLLIVLLILLI